MCGADSLTPSEDYSFSGYGISNWIPGMSFVKNSVIRPLMFATEKVIEQVTMGSGKEVPAQKVSSNNSN